MGRFPFSGSDDDRRYKYDGNNKHVNKILVYIFIGWILFLGWLAWLGSQGIVLPLK